MFFPHFLNVAEIHKGLKITISSFNFQDKLNASLKYRPLSIALQVIILCTDCNETKFRAQLHMTDDSHIRLPNLPFVIYLSIN